MTATGPSFDLTGALPSGTTVLEASAGTGKTYTIAGLVVRWVAETELRLPDLLVVTFTRAATAELRERVRRRLVFAADHLEALVAGRGAQVTDPAHDPVVAHLGAADPASIRCRHARLRRALTDVDAATIATIHGFCQHVLDSLGLASDFDREAELVEDTSELVAEVVDDLLVEAFLERGDGPQVARDELLRVAETAVSNPTTALVPREPEDDLAGLRLHLASRARAEVARRARRRRRWSYDDLLTRLDETLRDPDRGGAARRALRDRYRIALIDEFQDTDPVQWSIVRRAFGETAASPASDTAASPASDTAASPASDTAASSADPGEGRALVLIGDPKQAIYAFRGADVHSYLQARDEAAATATLDTSWRADAGLLRAFDAVFAGTRFGEAAIAYETVRAAPGHDRPRLVEAAEGSGRPAGPRRAPAGAAPLRLRLLPRHPELDQYRGSIRADVARGVVAADVAADIVGLLERSPSLIRRDHDGAEADRRPLGPGDIAVLVRTNAEAGLVDEALDQVDVPAVINGVDSVFATPATTDWQRLLDALERPASTRRVRALALSAWVGWTGEEVEAADEDDWERLHQDVHTWARILRREGIASLQRSVSLQRRLRPRLLSRRGGERRLTDLEHIGELAHAAASAEHLGPAALAAWLRERVAEASAEAQDERLRRLDTDDEAVQLLTIHRSKGLEFPVVYAPFLWSSYVDAAGAPVFHDAEGRRCIDVGGNHHADFDDHKRRAEAEARGEKLRLAYVAMTRAAHRVVVHWAPAGARWSPLGHLLAPDTGGPGIEPEDSLDGAGDEQARAAAEALAARSAGTVALETVPAEPSDEPWQPPGVERPQLAAASFDRGLDHLWYRTSYTGITRELARPLVASEPTEAIKDDEQLPPAPLAPGPPGDEPREEDSGPPLPLAGMPGGAEVGTLIHRVLEHSDLASDDLERELAARFEEQEDRRGLGLDRDRVVSGLIAVLNTALGPLTGDSTLAQVGSDHRRDEVDFELPLDRVGGPTATVDDLAGLMADHLPAEDPLADYPDQLASRFGDRGLRGYLAGSIDVVLRHERVAGPAFLVVDYKTNWLARPGEELTVWHYRPAALAEAMVQGDYPLQALLYQTALHRYLRGRLPGYDPEVHLGGVLYLFVRGMLGPQAPGGDDQGGLSRTRESWQPEAAADEDSRPGESWQPEAVADEDSRTGVFGWDPPTALITATSDLLHGVGGGA